MRIDISKETLYELYIIENKTITEISDRYGCSNTPIRKFLKQYNIVKDKSAIDAKRKQTCVVIYGGTSPQSSDVVREKRKSTNMDRYGAEYSQQSMKVREKISSTKRNMTASQLVDIAEKTKQTCNERYGIDNPFQLIDNVREGMLAKHGVANPAHLFDAMNKRTDTCRRRYGVTNPMQSESIKEKHKSTRIKNGNQVSDCDLSKYKIYFRECWRLSNATYNEHKHTIDPQTLRSNKFHLDHKFSIYEGFKHNVPAALIGSEKNLQILDAKTNQQKHTKSSISLDTLYGED
jgi:hypothetical protein